MKKSSEETPTTEKAMVLVRALFPLEGSGRRVEIGEEYLQPREAAERMAAAGWVVIISSKEVDE